MTRRLSGSILAIALLGNGGAIVAQSDHGAAAVQRDDPRATADRATVVFRLLNEAGIAFEKTRAKAFQSIEEGEYAEARKVCSGFLQELNILRSSPEGFVGLPESDLRYVENTLLRMQRSIEQLLDDLPPMF